MTVCVVRDLSWTLKEEWCRCLECVELYLRSPYTTSWRVRDMFTVVIPTCSCTPVQDSRSRHYRSILHYKKKIATKPSNTVITKQYSILVSFNTILNDSCSCTDSLWEIRPTSASTDMQIYCIINSAACYMFRPTIAAIFSEVFFEGYIAQNVKIYFFYVNVTVHRGEIPYNTCKTS
jgi:hypothetical protein